MVVFLVALATRLLYVSLVPPRTTPDSAEYRTLAHNVVAHAAFSFDSQAPYVTTIRRAPAYAVFLGLAGGAVRAVQGLLDALAAAMIFLLAATRVRLRWAAAAALLYVAHPGAIVYANAILSECLFTFLLTVTVALLVVAIHRDRLAWAAAAGVAMAVAALCRPVGAPLFLVLAGTIALSAAVPRRSRMAGVFCAAMLLGIAPWIIRSSLLAGRFVLVSTTGPVNLSLATAQGPWNLNDEATIFHGPYYWQVDPCGRSLTHAQTPRESAQSDDICLHEALGNLRRHPGYYARSRVSQLIHFPVTSFDFVTGNRNTVGAAIAKREYRGLALKLVLYAMFSFAPLLLGAAGALAGWRFMEIRLAAVLWIFTIAVHAPGFVEYRYFLPAVPMLLVCAAFGMEWLDQLLRPNASGARTRPAIPQRISNVTT